MPTGRIDREAWAHEVAAFIKRFDPGSRDPGNKSAFARRVGVTTKTIDRWLACQNDVSYDSVSQVVQRLDIPQGERFEMLHRIGYYSALGPELDKLIPEPPTYPDPRKDKVIQMILADPRLTEEQRVELVDLQIKLIEADVQHRMAQYNRMLGYEQERRATS